MSRWRCACGPVLALLGVGAQAADCESPYARSPQFAAEQCRFDNPPNPQAKAARSSYEIWKRFLLEDKVGTVPVDPIPVRPMDRAAIEALDAKSNHIVRLGHSSHLFKLHGTYWLIDPVFGERVSPVSWAGPKRFHAPPMTPQQLPMIDGLVLSHDHYDHLDEPTIKALLGRVQRYFVPLGVAERLRAFGVPADRIQEFDWWQSAEWAGVTLTAAPAQHFSGRGLFDRNKTLWAAWSLAAGGQRIFYSGDTGYFPGFREIGQKLGTIDIALMENGAYDSYWPAVHMAPEETVQAFQDLGAKTLYLVHNSTFDLAFHGWREPMERVANLAAQHGLDLATPEIGEVLTVGKPRENKRWWANLK